MNTEQHNLDIVRQGSQNRMTSLLTVVLYTCFWLNTNASLTSRIEGSISLNDTFAQVANMSNLYLEPDELFRLPLDDYFRGNFIRYKHYLTLSLEDGRKGLYDPDLAKITPPVVELVRKDFPQNETQLSLPQTSVIYTDPNTNFKYLIFIDFRMQLYIYDISSYFNDNTLEVPLVSVTDLFDSRYINSTSRTCNNLIVLQKNSLLMNCLAKGVDSYAVLVYIVLQDNMQLQIRYSTSQISFQAMRDGKNTLLKQFGNDEDFMILSKENQTTCYFDVLHFSVDFGISTTLIRRVSFFHELPLTDDQFARYKNDVIPDIRDCEQRSPIEFDQGSKTSIEFMQIQDFEHVPFHENVVVATDYNNGAMFMEIICSKQDNAYTCDYLPILIIKWECLSEITIFPEEGLIKEKILFIQVVNPPQVLEISYHERTKASIKRVYTISGDEGRYLSLSIIDANQDYVLAHLLSTEVMKPVVRIFKRGTSFLSLGHVEFTYTDFIDQGVFMQFISVKDNYVLLKTSDYFSIIKVQSQELIINATNYTYAKERGYVDHTIKLRLFAEDMYHERIETSMEFMILGRQRGKSMLRKYDSTNRNQDIEFYYNCGEMSLTINIDDLFEGAKETNLTMNDLSAINLQKFFEPSRYSFQQLPKKSIQLKGCSMKTIVEAQNSTSRFQMLQCVEHNGNNLFSVDLINCDCDNPRIIQNMTLSSVNFIEFAYDKNLEEMYFLSNITSSGQPGAVVHIMKLYNMLNWEISLDLNSLYPDLQEKFRFRDYNAITYQPNINMGIILSESQVINNGQTLRTTILMYDVESTSIISNMLIRSYLHIDLPIQSPQVSVQHSRLDRFGNVWVVLSNQTLSLYQQGQSLFSNGVTTSLSQLFLKKQLNFTNDPDVKGEDFLNIHIFAETKKMDKLALFFGKNKTVILRHVRGNVDLQKLMVLPLTYGDKDVDIETEINYEFAINPFIKDIVYQRYNNRLLFILMKRLHHGTLVGYSLFIYDIFKQKHGSLLVKQHLSSEVTINSEQAKIEIVGSGNQIQIYLFVDDRTLFPFTLKFQNEIEIDPNERKRLMQFCVKDDVNFKYEIYPLDDYSQKVNISVKAINTGLTITKIQERDSLSVSVSSQTDFSEKNKLYEEENEGVIKRGSEGLSANGGITIEDLDESGYSKYPSKDALYSLSRSFRGQNMTYKVECNFDRKQLESTRNNATQQVRELQPNDDTCKGFVSMHPQSLVYSREIEVLGSAVTLLGFFVVEPAMLFFDKIYLYVYFPEKELYQSIDLLNGPFFSTLDKVPSRYFIRSMKNYRSGDVTTYMIFQMEDFRFGISMIYSKATFNDTKMIRESGQFISVEDTIYFQRSLAPLMFASWSIAFQDIYIMEASLFEDEELHEFGDLFESFTDTKNSTFLRLVLAIYDPDILYNSLIMFWDVAFQNSTAQPVFRRNKEMKLLSVNRLDLDKFTVNSMSLIGNSSVLALGIENYGIILYCMLDFKVIKFVSFVEHYEVAIGTPSNFIITSVIPQGELMMLLAVVNNHAVFAVRVHMTLKGETVLFKYDQQEGDLDDFWDFNSIDVKLIYFDHQVKPSYRREMAKGKIGYAFIQGTTEKNDIKFQQSNEFVDTSSMSQQKVSNLSTPSINFFSFYASGNSKNIGEIELDQIEDCKYLQTMPYEMARTNFIRTFGLTQDSLIVVAICGGSTMKIMAMDYFPNLIINMSKVEEVQQSADFRKTVKIVSQNAYSEECSETTMMLDINISNQEADVSGIVIALFVPLTLLLVFIMYKGVKNNKVKEEDEDKKKAKLKKKQDKSTYRERVDPNTIGDDSQSSNNVNRYSGITDNSTIIQNSQGNVLTEGDKLNDEKLLNEMPNRKQVQFL